MSRSIIKEYQQLFYDTWQNVGGEAEFRRRMGALCTYHINTCHCPTHGGIGAKIRRDSLVEPFQRFRMMDALIASFPDVLTEPLEGLYVNTLV
jgi:hypothetical protein